MASDERAIEIQVHRRQCFQALGDMVAHQPLRILGPAVGDRIGDLAMAGIGVLSMRRAL